MNSSAHVATNAHSTSLLAIDIDAAWNQVIARDPSAPFFYAVETTGVFCRTSCSSKRPLRQNVRFFLSAEAARAAGFRACLRCKPDTAQPLDALAKVRAHVEANLDRAISLDELGRIAGLSPFTVQKLFKKELGVSPLQYQRALRAGRLRRELKQGGTVTEAIYEAGFGSASRAYEGSALGMTPSRFARGGLGERIGFATAPTSFGWMIVGATDRGLCWLALAESATAAKATLCEEFPLATINENPSLADMVEAALAMVGGEVQSAARESMRKHERTLRLDLRGTAFQLRVWQALRTIPRGETRTYSQLARELGDVKATRAVARACALNRVSVVVPCHRVVGVSGSLTGYRWGVERKKSLLATEKSS